MNDYLLIYRTSFYMVAATICVAAMVFVVLDGWLDRRQTRIYLFMLLDVIISSVGGIVYKLLQPYAVGNEVLTRTMLVFQFLDFFAHTALAPLFYFYVQNVIGAIHRRSVKKRITYMIPFFVLQFMVILNPFLGWIYYFDENYNFYRNWGEVITYIVAALYFSLSVFDILFYWSAVNKRRRLGLLYCFLVTLTGIVLQLLFINLSVELVSEAMGLILLMLVVEREDDRLDQSTRTYNRGAFGSDINNFIRLGRKFHIIYIRILNDDVLRRLTGSTDDEGLFREVVRYLRGVHSKYQIYRVRKNAFVLVCHNKCEKDVVSLATQINERFKESFHCESVYVRLKVSVLYASVPEDLNDNQEIMMLIDSGDSGAVNYNIGDNPILCGRDIPKVLYTASLEKALHRGITEHNYEVHYQPIYSMKDKSICGAEASICLNDPELSLVESKQLLPLAEKQGLDILLNNMLLDEVCMFMGSGIPLELGLNQISVAISVRQCIQPYFVDMLERLLSEYKLLPSMLNFEIPEPENAEQYDQLESVMKVLKEKGFSLSLDGFGTGYTNMKAFYNFGYDRVNINISALGESELSDIGKSILKYNIRMIRDMNMKVLIKESTEYSQVEWIEQTDASYLQSDYYSKVVTQSELISILRVTEIARQDEQRARAGSEAKSIFLANMSHEIRTPINAILGMNEMILRESRNDAVLSYARDIENASRGLLSLINDILDFSRIEAGNMEIVPVEYDLSSLLNDVVNMMRMRVEQKGLAFNINVDAELPEKLYGDEVRIRQVLLNLLNNALKYTEKGSIGLDVRGIFSSDHSVSIIFDVNDTGCGIKKKDQEKLFKSYDKSGEKMGLGLAISKKLLTLMDGNIQVESKYGEGSTFTAVIPQHVIDQKPIGDFKLRYQSDGAANSTYHEQFIAPTAHILVVDDTPINITVVKSLLKKTRIHIDTATSGMEGLEKCAAMPYDIIFLDYRMPEMDGVTVLKIMREMRDHPNMETPIILLTANALAGAREQFMAAGFDDYMTKPIDGAKLEEMLMRYLPEDKVVIKEGSLDDEESLEDEFLEKLSVQAGLDTDQGLSNCGSVDGYREVIEIYYDSIDDKISEIKRFYDAEDYDNYTIQVHSMKSTSKVIGAANISEKAAALENAGDTGDVSFIKSETDNLLEDVRLLKSKLSDILIRDESVLEEELPDADESMLNDAFKTLADFASMMDYENSVFVLNELKKYHVSGKDHDRIKDVNDAVERLDWEAVAKIVGERGDR